MRFLERNWPVILMIWMIFLITAGIVKLCFFSSASAEINFTVEEMMQGVRQNDSRLVEYIHGSQLFSPNLIIKDLDDNSQRPLNEIQKQITRDVIKVLQETRNGFFMECRAFSGNEYSKTLALELKYNWTGILLEPDPYLFPKLRANNRNAWLLNACLSPDPIAHNVDFLRKFMKKFSNDSISNEQLLEKSLYRDNKGQLWKKLQIPCFPLFSITSALRVNIIDFLILDNQGLELQILMNIPWAFIKINVITVNVQSIPEGSEGLKIFLTSAGYNLLSTVGNFYTFAHKSIHAVG